MVDSTPWIDTEPATWVRNAAKSHSNVQNHDAAAPMQPPPVPTASTGSLVEDEEVFARLVPDNRGARQAFAKLAQTSSDLYPHHHQFMQVDPREGIDDWARRDCFIFSLGLLPQYPVLGWRIGKGRPKIKNNAVDILVPDGDEMAGVHARFCWIKGSGGFFIVADNLRGKAVILNGERLQNSQRLIPYRNSIRFGECSYTVRFETRTPAQEEEFQIHLASFYKNILQDAAPLALPTPSEFEVRIGNWIVRAPIASGTFGRVSNVTHVHTGQAAAMKELWKTHRNALNVQREVDMARMLQKIPHVSTFNNISFVLRNHRSDLDHRSRYIPS